MADRAGRGHARACGFRPRRGNARPDIPSKLAELDAGLAGDGHEVLLWIGGPAVQAGKRAAHVASVADRRLAELALDDVLRQLRHFLPGDFGCEFAAEPRADE